MRNLRTGAVTAAVVITLAGALALPALAHSRTHVSASSAGTVTVLASGLNNPRGLSLAHHGLYVAEAGTGGTDCPAGALGPDGGPLCVGLTGALARISGGVARPIRTGLISISDIPGGLAAEGLETIAADHQGLRVAFGESVVGLLTTLPHGVSLNPTDSAAARAQLGMLISVAGGRSNALADVGDADFSWSAVHQNLVPDQFPDANPNALAVVGSTTYVVDAGANTLDAVDRRGHVTQLVFFPNSGTSDAVPTCVAAGPDRKLYIGQLAPGAPPNGGNIYRYDPQTGRLSVWETGFNVVDGCGFDPAGNFYAVEFQSHGFNPSPSGNPAGDIIRIAKNGKRTVLGAGQLFYPQSFATDRHNRVYVSNWSILTGTPSKPGAPTGQVVRVTTG